MVRIDKSYTFARLDKKVQFVDLFQARRQLIVYHGRAVEYEIGGPRESEPQHRMSAANE